jgi:heme/copper-type cytochrome/quinol oxidase subunit 3
MTAKDHNRLIGLFFLIWGGLQILGLGIAILAMLGVGGTALFGAHSRDAVPIAAVFGITTVILVIAMILTIPAIIAGLKMRKEKPGAKTWVLIAAILALVNFPLGTALGVYALWFMFGDQGKSFYSGGSTGNSFNQPPPPNNWR